METKSRAEFIGNIIDIFEDYCEKQGIDIPNEEREDDEDAAIIYGSHYDMLADPIRSLFENPDSFEFGENEQYEGDRIHEAIDECLKVFEELTGVVYDHGFEELVNIFDRWDLFKS